MMFGKTIIFFLVVLVALFLMPYSFAQKISISPNILPFSGNMPPPNSGIFTSPGSGPTNTSFPCNARPTTNGRQNLRTIINKIKAKKLH